MISMRARSSLGQSIGLLSPSDTAKSSTYDVLRVIALTQFRTLTSNRGHSGGAQSEPSERGGEK